MSLRSLLAVLATLAATSASAAPKAAEKSPSPSASVGDPIAKYFSELEAMKLIDAESGTLESLRKELAIAEGILRDGAYTNAAVALYAIVKSPRYAAFTDFVEYQNAEYDLVVALERSKSYGAALEMTDKVLERGPSAPYWGPAHRRGRRRAARLVAGGVRRLHPSRARQVEQGRRGGED